MKTKIMNLKNFRQNMTSIWKEARKSNIKYIILHHSKPIFEVYPKHEEELIFEEPETDRDYYKTIEQTLDFWQDDADDDIFA